MQLSLLPNKKWWVRGDRVHSSSAVLGVEVGAFGELLA